MKIECILLRPGGTFASIGNTEYHFAPDADDRHVADVKIEAHIERFLSIPEAYRIYRAAGTAEPEPVVVPPADEPVVPEVDASELLASKSHPDAFTIEGKAYALTDVALRAFQDSGLTVEDWNGLDDETRATKIDIVLDGIAAGEIEIEEADGVDTEGNDDRDELKAMYKARFGKDPGRLSTARIKAALEQPEE